MHFVHLQMHFVNLQNALLCIWRTSRYTSVHLAMPFGHLELPGGVPRGPFDMCELPIENLGEYGDSSRPTGFPKAYDVRACGFVCVVLDPYVCVCVCVCVSCVLL